MNDDDHLDLRLYLVTDPDLCPDEALLDVVDQATAGGVGLVQLRDKEAAARDLLEKARALKALLDPKGVPLVVNDRVDVAAAAGVGCHLGQTDLPPAAARVILGQDAIIGLSVDEPDQTLVADLDSVDYVAYGPFAATGTKRDAGKPVGSGGIERARASTVLPLVAIGGIDVINAADAIRAGADGIAVVSALMAAHDPKAVAETLLASVDRTIREQGEARLNRSASG